MTSYKSNCETGIAFADGNARQPYQTPRLVVFGNVGSLTQTGTKASIEDVFQNGVCKFPNTYGNMC